MVDLLSEPSVVRLKKWDFYEEVRIRLRHVNSTLAQVVIQRFQAGQALLIRRFHEAFFLKRIHDVQGILLGINPDK